MRDETPGDSPVDVAGSEISALDLDETGLVHDTQPEGLLIAGVGASAGGLEALQQLFEALPNDTGMGLVVVQHLSPDFRSVMDELLARHTDMPVVSASDGQKVEANHVYLMPPSVSMELRGGILRLRQRDPTKRLHLPIDDFFTSLAADVGARAVAVVLSGTGSDGSRGIREISRAGGLVMVQSEATSKFDGMPRSAIDTGVVDLIDEPKALAAAMARAAQGLLRDDAVVLPLRGDDLGPILDLLREESGIDFSRYKPATIGRRIERRLTLGRHADLADYLATLRDNPKEVKQLYCDLLIGVTRFFRDPEAFEILRDSVLPDIIDSIGEEDTLRIWVAACATGEEAYSIAMLAMEALRESGSKAQLKLFATDVHQASLEIAAEGVYSANAVSSIPHALRLRYMVSHEEGYMVSRELRSCIVFAPHNILRDAPFTRLDLVSCRNFLIYLRPDAQRKALSSIHFGIKNQGFLFLGSSETPTQLQSELTPVHRRWKIFRKRRDRRLPLHLDSNPSQAALRRRNRTVGPIDAAHRALVRHFAPPALVVNQELRLLHSLNGGARYLEQRDGNASLDILTLLEPGLRGAVSAGLQRVHEADQPLVYENLRLASGERIRLTLVPVTDAENRPGARRGTNPQAGNTMLTIETLDEPMSSIDIEVADADTLAVERIDQLEQELKHTQANLQAALEEMETSNEELQAANEELTAANEELQSTNEELQSVNEELYMVNAEYQAKISELTEMTDDMHHLLEATEVHTAFLDSDLRLRRFTPKIGETFNLLSHDLGRQIESFAHNLLHDGLMDDLRTSMAEGKAIEHQVRDRRGRWYLLRILPYRPGGVEILGVVLTLIDISAVRAARDDLERQESRYRALVRVSSSTLWLADAEGRITEYQPEWAAYTGQGEEEQMGDGWLGAVHEDDRAEVAEAWSRTIETRQPLTLELRLWDAESKRYRYNTLSAAPVAVDGEISEWVVHAIDCHDSQEAAAKLRERENQLQAFLHYSPSALYLKDVAGRYMLCNRQAAEIIGHPVEDIIGKTDMDLLPLEVALAVRNNDHRVIEEGRAFEFNERLPRDGGSDLLFLTQKFPLLAPDQSILGVGGVSSDITEREEAAERDRRALQRRDRFLALLSHELRNPLSAVVSAAGILGFDELETEPRQLASAVISSQCLHMSLLLDDLLDVTRLNVGKLEIRWLRVDLLEAARAALASVESGAEGQGVELEVKLPEGPLEVMGDLSRLQQIQANLLGNAIKFTHRGGRVRFSVREENGRAVLEVEDTGRGIGADDLDRIFSFFFQRDRLVERGQGGIGVGLSLVKSLTEMHAGAIEVASEGKGRGSRFRVILPLADDAPTEAPSAAPVDGSPFSHDAPLIEEWSPAMGRQSNPTLRRENGESQGSPEPVPGPSTGGRGSERRPANGRSTNGRSTNGRSTNGRSTNGRSTNGRSTNGRSTSGRSTKGHPAENPDHTKSEARGHTTAGSGSRGPAPTGGESSADRLDAESLSIVVVEDSVTNRDALKTLLELLGHRVDTASDGPEGVEKILSTRPDLALVDIGLPGLTGDQVVGQVREQWQGDEPFFVAVTGYGSKADREALLSAGFERYVIKPLTADLLDQILAEAMERRNTAS